MFLNFKKYFSLLFISLLGIITSEVRASSQMKFHCASIVILDHGKQTKDNGSMPLQLASYLYSDTEKPAQAFLLFFMGLGCLLIGILHLGSFVLSVLGMLLLLCGGGWIYYGEFPLSYFLKLLQAILYVGLPIVLISLLLWKKGYLKKLLKPFLLTQHVKGETRLQKDYIGKKAVVVSPLMPHGKIRVGDEILEAFLMDTFAQPGDIVVIIARKDFAYLVTKEVD